MPKPRIILCLEKRARRHRHSLFVELLSRIERPLKILDVGGTYDYWRQTDVAALGNVRIVLLNLFPQDGLVPPFSAAVGDARDLSRYADKEFDVVFSNSLLGQAGRFADQMRMSSEIRRVGKHHFVQTPNHSFIIDWRTLVPCFHFLPVSFQALCFRNFSVGTYQRVTDRATSLQLASRIRNVRKRELRLLFPDSTVVCERFLGMTKSFMIQGGFSRSEPNAKCSRPLNPTLPSSGPPPEIQIIDGLPDYL